MDSRYQALTKWVAQQLQQDQVHLSVVSGDASFRRYFRCELENKSWVIMDAPPDKEDTTSFVQIAQYWFDQGIFVPEVIALDKEQGFILLSDLGDQLLLPVLNPHQPIISEGNRYYAKAMETLLQIQGTSSQALDLPPYDSALLQREMALFKDWLLEKKLGISLLDAENKALTLCLNMLEKRALEQLQVTVHRDYHARNIMICEGNKLGIIDFQDAVKGPITYDLVSLLRDCYIVWPAEQVAEWVTEFYHRLKKQGYVDLVKLGDVSRFKQDFDLMGLQRHLKVAGIFARLSLRDGKHAYLRDIPRTLDYILSVSRELLKQNSQEFAFLAPLVNLVEQRVLPLTLQDDFLPDMA